MSKKPESTRREIQHARVEEELQATCSRPGCEEFAPVGLGMPPENFCLQHLAERVEEVRMMTEEARA